MKRLLTTLVLIGVFLLAAPAGLAEQSALQAPLAPNAGITELISVSSSGEQGNELSSPCEISLDGRFVVFDSMATNLVSGDTNNTWDTFLRDRWNGTTELISVSSIGEQGNDWSSCGYISADMHFVAFNSFASNMVIGDTNAIGDVFVRDLWNGTTERISVSTHGDQANGESYLGDITPDGRFVVFSSDATNLVNGDTNGYADVFIHDRLYHTTRRVSLSTDEKQGNGTMEGSQISDDGRFVIFDSYAPNLVGRDTNNSLDIFIRDRQLGVTNRVSKTNKRGQGNMSSMSGQITGDGRYIVFSSDATNLVEEDTNGYQDIFLRDQISGHIELVSIASDGEQATDNSQNPVISEDGRYVAFHSWSTNLVDGDTNGFWDTFLRDRQTNRTELISQSTTGEQGNNYSFFQMISADGRYVVFFSHASNLVIGDTNNDGDVFLRDRLTPMNIPLYLPLVVQ